MKNISFNFELLPISKRTQMSKYSNSHMTTKYENQNKREKLLNLDLKGIGLTIVM